MAKIIRRKVQVNATLSPILAKKIDEGVESEKYSSQSDLVSMALTEYFVREEIREYQDRLVTVYQKLLEDETGRKLLKEMPGDKTTQIEALKKKGVACVELGDLEEAMKCFARAQELEEEMQKASGSNSLPSTSTKRVVIK